MEESKEVKGVGQLAFGMGVLGAEGQVEVVEGAQFAGLLGQFGWIWLGLVCQGRVSLQEVEESKATKGLGLLAFEMEVLEVEGQVKVEMKSLVEVLEEVREADWLETRLAWE